MPSKSYRFAAILSLAVLSIAETSAQAYCALRDPVGAIKKLNPEATGHRSIVRTIKGDDRREVGEKLPFTLHFNELGKHTLYALVKGDTPVGIIHSRSEKGRWGMVEIVWHLDLDLKVQGFEFQRCRDRASKTIGRNTFVRQIRGKGFDELKALLSPDCKSLAPGGITVPGNAADLAVVTLRSALKTIAITGITWQDTLADLRKEAHGGTTEVEVLIPIESVYNDRVIGILKQWNQDEEFIIDRSAATAHKQLGSDGGVKALRVRTVCTSDHRIATIDWVVGANQELLSVEPVNGWPSQDVRESFENLPGMSAQEIGNCETAGELAAAEVLAIASVHLGNR